MCARSSDWEIGCIWLGCIVGSLKSAGPHSVLLGIFWALHSAADPSLPKPEPMRPRTGAAEREEARRKGPGARVSEQHPHIWPVFSAGKLWAGRYLLPPLGMENVVFILGCKTEICKFHCLCLESPIPIQITGFYQELRDIPQDLFSHSCKPHFR